jgi:hypothetical protein
MKPAEMLDLVFEARRRPNLATKSLISIGALR